MRYPFSNTLIVVSLLLCAQACDKPATPPVIQPQDLVITGVGQYQAGAASVVSFGGLTHREAMTAARDGKIGARNLANVVVVTPRGHGVEGTKGGTGARPWLQTETVLLGPDAGWSAPDGAEGVTLHFDGKSRSIEVQGQRVQLDDGDVVILNLKPGGGIDLSQSEPDLANPAIPAAVRDELRKRHPEKYPTE